MELFGDVLPAVTSFAELLVQRGIPRGLLGPREADRIWERHLLNCALLEPFVPPDASVADIGSGAGLPGIVLALQRPDLTVSLIEPLLRRTTFLAEVIAELDLANVEVVRARADAVAGTRRWDVVTARAVASLGALIRWSAPLLAPRGTLRAMKGAQVVAGLESEETRQELERYGSEAPAVIRLGAAADTTTLVQLTLIEPPVSGTSRRRGSPAPGGGRRRSVGGQRPAPSSRSGHDGGRT